MNKLPKKRIGIAYIVAVVLAVAAAIVLFVRQRPDSSPRQDDAAPRVRKAKSTELGHSIPANGAAKKSKKSDGKSSSEVEQEQAEDASEPEAMTEEERREAEEEKKVEAFDSLTDDWMKKDGGEVTMKDMDDFVSAFKSVPAHRREECLHRALNLVSDEHVLLLAGILFDKSVDKEYVELVFNDVLNRDESVKKLILPKIFKDRTHPCWADAAWILDVTGETPKTPKPTKEKAE